MGGGVSVSGRELYGVLATGATHQEQPMAFDTHASVKKLQEAGFTPQQAEAQVEMVLALVEGNLATKHDIELLRQDTKEMETRLNHKIELARRDTVIWLGGIVVAGFAVMAAMIGVVIAFVAL